MITLTADETHSLYSFWQILTCQEIVLLAEEREAQEALITEALKRRRAESRAAHTIPFLAAPNCDPDILTHPPHIRRDSEGLQRVELRGSDGWRAEGVVEEVVRLERGAGAGSDG